MFRVHHHLVGYRLAGNRMREVPHDVLSVRSVPRRSMSEVLDSKALLRTVLLQAQRHDAQELPDIVRAVACGANDMICFVEDCLSMTLSFDACQTSGVNSKSVHFVQSDTRHRATPGKHEYFRSFTSLSVPTWGLVLTRISAGAPCWTIH